MPLQKLGIGIKNITETERFLNKITKSEGLGPCGDCWEWTAGLDGKGYGAFAVKGRMVQAHKYSYSLFKGSIPDGLFVLHSCDNRKCVNPKHLSLGTNADNVHDMLSKGRQNHQLVKVCPKGHFYDAINTLITKQGRVCRICKKEAAAKYFRVKQSHKEINIHEQF